MRKSILELSKHSIVYGIGILSRLSVFILLPMHTAYLSQHDYGILILVLSFIGIAQVLTSYGLNVSFLRWYVPETDPEERRRIFSVCYYGIAGVSILLALIVYFMSGNLAGLILHDSGFDNLFSIAAMILLLDALFHFPQILLQARKSSWVYVSVVFLNVGINLGLNYYFLVVKGRGIESVLYAAVVAAGSAFIVTLPTVIKHLKLYFSKEKYKEYFKYGIPYVANTLFVVLIDLIDRFLLERFIDAEKVAIYSANYKIGSAMAIVINAFRMAWHPFFLSISNTENAKETFARVFTYLLLLSCGIFLFISILIEDLVRIDFGGFHIIAESYWEGTFIIPWILFSYIVMGAFVIFSAGIHIEKKTKYTPIFTGIGLIVNIAANLILIPLIGIYGAAIATLASYLAMTAVQYFTVQKFYHVNYEFKRIALLLTITLLIVAVAKFLFADASISLKLLILTAYPVLLVIFGFFSADERKLISDMYGKLTRKSG